MGHFLEIKIKFVTFESFMKENFDLEMVKNFLFISIIFIFSVFNLYGINLENLIYILLIILVETLFIWVMIFMTEKNFMCSGMFLFFFIDILLLVFLFIYLFNYLYFEGLFFISVFDLSNLFYHLGGFIFFMSLFNMGFLFTFSIFYMNFKNLDISDFDSKSFLDQCIYGGYCFNFFQYEGGFNLFKKFNLKQELYYSINIFLLFSLEVLLLMSMLVSLSGKFLLMGISLFSLVMLLILLYLF